MDQDTDNYDTEYWVHEIVTMSQSTVVATFLDEDTAQEFAEQEFGGVYQGPPVGIIEPEGAFITEVKRFN